MAKRATSRRNMWPFSEPAAYKRGTTPARGGIAAHMPRAMSGVRAQTRAATRAPYKGYRLWDVEDGVKTSADPESTFEDVKQAHRFIDSVTKRANPGLSQKVRTISGRRALLTNTHSASSYGEPVLIISGKAYGPGDLSKHDGLVTPVGKQKEPWEKLTPKEEAEWEQRVSWNDAVTRFHNPGSPGSAFKRCVSEVSERGGAVDPNSVCAAAGRKKYGVKKFAAMSAAGKRRAARGNPAAQAAEVYEDFHGTPSTEVVEVTSRIHFHEHLAALGTLEYLKLDGVDGYRHTVKGFKGAILCSNEKRNQLFIRGGDTAVELSDFGIRKPHEKESLGFVTEIGYKTDKKHLGDEGGKALYFHKTGDEGGSSPELVYNELDEDHLEFVGGSYEIKREGIRN